MQAEKRQFKIGNYLQQAEFASLEELAREVDVSVSTVRRDLSILEATGAVRRTHGGARIIEPSTEEFTFSKRDTHQLAEKEAIGRACAELITSHQSLILDAGTTVYHVARHLEPKTPHIVTNSLPVANLFGSANRLEVVLSGGVIYPRLGVLVGPLAVEAFRTMQADTAIMGAGGLTLEGITNSHVLLIEIQKAMMEAVHQVIFCLDHTKLGRRSFTKLCDLDQSHTIVTDQGAPPAVVEQLRRRGIEVVIAAP